MKTSDNHVTAINEDLRGALNIFNDQSLDDVFFDVADDGSISAEIVTHGGDVTATYAVFVEIAPVI